jgi:hypothetical protein
MRKVSLTLLVVVLGLTPALVLAAGGGAGVHHRADVGERGGKWDSSLSRCSMSK